MDVKALCVKGKYGNYPKKTVATKLITTFLTLVLTLNNFVFSSKCYLQIKGCSKRTVCGPKYANIFMSEFRERYIHPLIKSKSCTCLCFMDDIFMAYTKLENQFEFFIIEINAKHHIIKFDYKFSRKKIEVLGAFPKSIEIAFKQHFIRIQLTTKIVSMQNLHILFH